MFQLSEHSPLATVGGTQEYITQASAQTHTVWNVFLTGVNLMSVQYSSLLYLCTSLSVVLSVFVQIGLLKVKSKHATRCPKAGTEIIKSTEMSNKFFQYYFFALRM